MSRGFIGIASAAALAGMLAPAGPARAQDRPVLEQWLSGQFETVAETCLDTSSRPRRRPQNPNYIPDNVRRWDLLSGRLDRPAEIHGSDSLESYFAQVRMVGDGAAAFPSLQPLGVTHGDGAARAFYIHRTNSVLQHNCATMLSGAAGLNLGLNVGQSKLAVDASIVRDVSEAIYLYGGTIVSPVAAALDLDTTEVDRRAGVDPFSTYLALWAWYRAQSHAPQVRTAGDAGRLEITRQIMGLATYRMSGLTQNVLMTGNAQVGGMIPFLRSSASVTTDGRGETGIRRAGFGVAVFERETAILPGPRATAANGPRWAAVTPLADNAAEISGAQAFDWAADLAGVPSQYCNKNFWTLDAPDAAAFDLGDFRAAPAPGAPRVCRFVVRATPKPVPQNATANVARLIFGVKSALPNASTDPRAVDGPTFDVPIAATEIADLRASISLANPSAPQGFVLPSQANVPLAVTLTYVVHERAANRRVGEVVPGSTYVELGCGSDAVQGVPLGADDVTFGRTGGQARLVLTLRLAQGSLTRAAQAAAQCRLSGQMTVTVVGGQPVSLTLPTHGFSVQAPPPPSPVVQPAPPPPLGETGGA